MPMLNILSLSSNNSKATSSSTANQNISQLPVLAISPPSRPHTPQNQSPQPRRFTQPSFFSSSSSSSSPSPPPLGSPSPLQVYTTPAHYNINSEDALPSVRPNTPPSGPYRHQRPRSYSVKNGLLSPELPPPHSPTSSIPDSPKSPWNWGTSSRDSVLSDNTDSGAPWCESPTDTGYESNPDPFASPYAVSLLSNGQGPSEGVGGRKSVYHIYHSGALGQSFSVHFEPDSIHSPHKKAKAAGSPPDEPNSTPPTSFTTKPKKLHLPNQWEETEHDPRVPIYFLHQPRLNNHLPKMTLRWGGDGRDFIREKYVKPGKGKDKDKVKKPPKRKRDMKYAPVICQISCDVLWRHWDLEFAVLVPRDDDPSIQRSITDERSHSWAKWQGFNKAEGSSGGRSMVFKGKDTKDKSTWVYKGLNERGILDGRGIISSWYPFKKGMFGWRAAGETGKEWAEKEAERIKRLRRKSTSDIRVAKARLGHDEEQDKEGGGNTNGDDDNLVLVPPERLPRHLWPIQLDPVPEPSQSTSNSQTLPPPTSTSKNPKKGPPNPSKVTLKWSNILSREYAFTYLNTNFYWRGTKELNHYASVDHNETEEVEHVTQADKKKEKKEKETIIKTAVEEDARKKKGMDPCIWAHLKLVVYLPRDAAGGGLGLVGLKRSLSPKAHIDDEGVGVDGVGFERVRRNSSFSSMWGGVTRRNTITEGETAYNKDGNGGETKDRKDYNDHDGNQHENPNRPLSRKNSFLTSLLHSRPTTPTSPPRSSTWGTSTSTSTLHVPRLSRTFTNQSHASSSSPLVNPNTTTTSSSSSTKNEEMVEVVLARYSCVLSVRKAGRLVVDEEALERVAGHFSNHDVEAGSSSTVRVRYINPPGGVEANAEEDLSTQKERLRHLIVGTGLCMIIGEKQKRDTARDIILAAATEGAGAS